MYVFIGLSSIDLSICFTITIIIINTYKPNIFAMSHEYNYVLVVYRFVFLYLTFV